MRGVRSTRLIVRPLECARTPLKEVCVSPELETKIHNICDQQNDSESSRDGQELVTLIGGKIGDFEIGGSVSSDGTE